jgi:hypothetical protein
MLWGRNGQPPSSPPGGLHVKVRSGSTDTRIVRLNGLTREPFSRLRRHSCMMRFLRLILLAVAIAMTPLVDTQIANATAMTKGIVEVTGFRSVCCDGSSGPIVVVAKGPWAVAIKASLAQVTPFSVQTVCNANVGPFKVTLRPREGARPTLVAFAFSCGGEGLIVNAGKSGGIFTDTCALQRAVLAVLPAGRATGTREALPRVCSVSGGT